jgi:hypothetical protein
VSAYDDWMPEPTGEPAIAVGYGVGLDGGWPNGMAPEGRWAHRARADDIYVHATDGETVGRFSKTMYLGEVAARGRSLADQAAHIAKWAHGALLGIARQDPALGH